LNLSNEKLKLELDRLSEQVKEDRKARGLPSESPKPFVSVAMGWTLFQRCKPLIDFAIQYANIVDKANEIIELSEEQKEWVNQFKIYAILARETSDTLLNGTGSGAISLINLLTNQSKYELVSEYLKLLYYGIQLTRTDYGEYRLNQFTYNHNLDNKENELIYNESKKEVERLKDIDYFNQELEKLAKHYESIKHLY